MTLPSGTRLGPFEVTALLGAGGMGEVYRATDTQLDRDVALKLVPDPPSPPIRSVWPASFAKPKFWPRSITRTSRRSTASTTPAARDASSWSCWKVKRCGTGSRADR